MLKMCCCRSVGLILILCRSFSKVNVKNAECSSALICVLTLVPNLEEDMSLTLFSPFSASDSFIQPFINILALVVQKMGQVR